MNAWRYLATRIYIDCVVEGVEDAEQVGVDAVVSASAQAQMLLLPMYAQLHLDELSGESLISVCFC